MAIACKIPALRCALLSISAPQNAPPETYELDDRRLWHGTLKSSAWRHNPDASWDVLSRCEIIGGCWTFALPGARWLRVLMCGCWEVVVLLLLVCPVGQFCSCARNLSLWYYC